MRTPKGRKKKAPLLTLSGCLQDGRNRTPSRRKTVTNPKEIATFLAYVRQGKKVGGLLSVGKKLRERTNPSKNKRRYIFTKSIGKLDTSPEREGKEIK